MLSIAIKQRLEAIPSFDLLADGGVYTERVDRERTPGAFNEQPPNLPRRSVSIVQGIVTSVGPGITESVCTAWIRWSDIDTETMAAEILIGSILQSLNQNVVGGEGLPCAMMEFVDRFDQRDPWINGGRMSYLRFRAAGVISAYQ